LIAANPCATAPLPWLDKRVVVPMLADAVAALAAAMPARYEIAVSAGLQPKAIHARLGHATIAETMNTYGHLFPDADDLGRGAIDTAFGAASPMCARCVPDASAEC
jgi:hypothetical protein